MGYVDYVESAILESGLEETGELLELLEEATSAEDLEAIEGYLTEKKANPNAKPRKTRDLTMRDIRRIEGIDMKSRLKGLASNAYTSARTKVGRAAVTARKDNIFSVEDADNVFDKATSHFDKGAIAVGATALLAAITGISLKVRKMIKNSNSSDAKQLEKQMKALEDQAKDVAKRCNKGEITAKEAKMETKKIQAQMKRLAKEAASVEKATKESVDMDITDIQLAIYESCDEGEISEEDRDELLEMLEG